MGRKGQKFYYIYKIHFLCGFPSGRYYIGKRTYQGVDSLGDTNTKSACIKEVIQLDLNGNEIKKGDSVVSAEKELKIHHSGISMCCTGKRNNAGGYKGKYVD